MGERVLITRHPVSPDLASRGLCNRPRGVLGPSSLTRGAGVLYIIDMGLINLRKVSVAFLFAFVFSNNAVKAAGGMFDGGAGGVSFSEAVLDLKGRAALLEAPVPPVVEIPRAVIGLRVYDFKQLYGSLGYPRPDFFGANETEIMDLDSYTSKSDTFYKEINGYLRFHPGPYDWYGTGPEDAKLIVENIDHIFTLVPPLPGDLALFRGVDLKFRGNKSYAINEEFVDKGYVSTSTSYKVARYFAEKGDDEENTGSKRAVFALYNNLPGDKGILIDQNEDEVILRHGLTFKVMGKRVTEEKYDLYLVQICGRPCEASMTKDVRAFWDNFKQQ